jgi:glycogen debranching enzyme
MNFNGTRPVALTHELRFGGETVVFSMTNRDMELIHGTGRIPRDTFLFRRILSFDEDTLFETVDIKNFSDQPHLLDVQQWAGGRFDDVFEVRGFARARRGRVLEPEEIDEGRGRVSVLRYEGLDGKLRTTFIHRLFHSLTLPGATGLVGASIRIEVPPKETVSLKSVVSFDRPSSCRFLGRHYHELSIPEKMGLLADKGGSDSFAALQIESDNAIINRAIHNAQTDIFMLLTEEPNQPLYPYAGVPWFSAPFGRDGMITAYQLLPWYPGLAKGVLEYAFQLLGSRVDPFTDEQPGKVFHEMRRGEMAKTREVPFIPYYGSVDSTPLCLILLHDYIRWTMDLESLRNWWPCALRALAWIERWGDPDHDGFLEYAKMAPTGLVNQGWKDSHDSIMHANGEFAQAPIRLCEVQGYAFRARMGMSALAKLMNREELSARLRLEALQLKSRFTDVFWSSDGNYVYLALDGKGQPCKVKSSNMGHCLWSQILKPEQARGVADHLMSESMFSGYGIRTLADTEKAYNPLSYHNGSVWPHDNAIIMEGFRNYGYLREMERLAVALMEVLETSQDFRLPELYCGFRKRQNEPPVPYEVACKPQAWAAGSVYQMLRSMLGVSIDLEQKYLVLNSPLLTPKMNQLQVRGLRGPGFEVDLLFRRTRSHETVVEVTRKQGPVRVLTIK